MKVKDHGMITCTYLGREDATNCYVIYFLVSLLKLCLRYFLRRSRKLLFCFLPETSVVLLLRQSAMPILQTVCKDIR